MFDLTGKTLGKYRLLEKIGQGGMAQVYKAYQPDLDRYVAIKILHSHLTGDEDFEARFRREARAVAALEHPNILRVYDFDTAEGVAFLVMEYLEGNTLKDLLRDQNCRGELMDFKEVGRITCALADALDHAHRQGVVHRDIKPSNVIITTNARPVLADFGIARMVDSTVITESGGTLGTPAYMSPEQGKGEPGDARSDVYAMGVILYQLCTGQLPFDADTPYAIILKHITAPLPPPRTVRPDLPEAIERVILKALAKDPNDRFQTAGELNLALHNAIESGQAVRAPSVSAARRRAIPRAAILVPFAVVLVLGLLLIARPWQWQPSQAQPTPTLPPVGGRATLVVQGPDVTDDTWLNPDLPNEVWQETDQVHLQGPLTPDRFLMRFDLPDLPAGATVVSATLTLHVELWGQESFPGAAVVYRVLVPWDPITTTYNSPWSTPGMAAGIDYDPTLLDMIPVPDAGWLTFDVGRAVDAWYVRGAPNNGLVVMMSADSHNQAHHWLYTSEQPDPADRPTLRVAYTTSP